MRAGRLRHSVTIQRPVIVRNEIGGPGCEWEAQCTVRASVTPIAGQERFDTDITHAYETYNVRFRYVEGVTPAFRLIYHHRSGNDRILDIQDLIDIGGKGREVAATCTWRIESQ